MEDGIPLLQLPVNEDEEELVTVVPRDLSAHFLGQHAKVIRNALEQLIGRLVAVDLVESLEVVQVRQHDGELPTLQGELVEKGPGVRAAARAGQKVVLVGELQLLHQLLQGACDAPPVANADRQADNDHDEARQNQYQ